MMLFVIIFSMSTAAFFSGFLIQHFVAARLPKLRSPTASPFGFSDTAVCHFGGRGLRGSLELRYDRGREQVRTSIRKDRFVGDENIVTYAKYILHVLKEENVTKCYNHTFDEGDMLNLIPQRPDVNQKTKLVPGYIGSQRVALSYLLGRLAELHFGEAIAKDGKPIRDHLVATLEKDSISIDASDVRLEGRLLAFYPNPEDGRAKSIACCVIVPIRTGMVLRS